MNLGSKKQFCSIVCSFWNLKMKQVAKGMEGYSYVGGKNTLWLRGASVVQGMPMVYCELRNFCYK